MTAKTQPIEHPLKTEIARFENVHKQSLYDESGLPISRVHHERYWPQSEWWLAVEKIADTCCETVLPVWKLEPASWLLRRLLEYGPSGGMRAGCQIVQRVWALRDAADNSESVHHESVSELNHLWRSTPGADEEQLSKTRGCSREQAAKIMQIQPWEKEKFVLVEEELEGVLWPQDLLRNKLAAKNRALFNSMREKWLRHVPFSEIPRGGEEAEMEELFASA